MRALRAPDTVTRRTKFGAALLIVGFLSAGSAQGSNRTVRIEKCPRDSQQVYVPAGDFTMGSTPAEREYAYALDRNVTRSYGWYEREVRKTSRTASFCIDRLPVTNAQYKSFIAETHRPEPTISFAAYQHQGFLVHPYSKVQGFLWRGGSFPRGTDDHPVVLVAFADAQAYCAWKGTKAGRPYRLPTEEEWEKSARGTTGQILPWGEKWQPEYLNSGDRFGYTTAVDRFPRRMSPYGLYDMAGNVFEWTSTAWEKNKAVLKSCSWDDLPGTCRTAMRHGRPVQSKHILTGFRYASDSHPQR